jgi:FMN reductase
VATILIVSGSPSPGSRTQLLARNVGERLAAAGFDVDFINVRDLPADDLISARADTPVIKEAIARVEAARALVVATPVYKAAYAGTLKTFLDLLPQLALAGKTVLPLATGGTLAHVLSIDYALRPVLAALGARHVVNGYFFLDKQLERLQPEGLRIEAQAEEKFVPVLDDFAASVGAQLDSVRSEAVRAAAAVTAGPQQPLLRDEQRRPGAVATERS